MRVSLSCSIVLFVLACGASHRDATPTVYVNAEHGLDTAEAYRTAIASYIQVLGKRDGSFPDTIHIGRHGEFPDIELPAVIERTSVRIVSPAEAVALKAGARFTYLNIFGWSTAGQVEFYVVNFKQGMRHWPDGRDDRHLRFAIGADQRELVLDSVWQ